jgi:hypothetical protein
MEKPHGAEKLRLTRVSDVLESCGRGQQFMPAEMASVGKDQNIKRYLCNLYEAARLAFKR